MDNGNFPDLGQLLYALKDNPQLLQMLMGMMGGAPKNEPRTQSGDVFSKLMGLQGGAEKTDGGASFGNTKDDIFGSADDNKKRINLLNAVRPYLSESRQARVDTAIKLLKIAEIGGLSKILGGK